MRLINFWYNNKINCFYWWLLPIEFFYLMIILLRKKLYKYKIFKTHKFNIPIIVIGNLTVGGTGKTPMVMYIANYLKNQGLKPAIIMRGYKSKYESSNRMVTKNCDPNLYGDEPVLVANNVDCPVMIGKNRVASCDFLLKNFNIDIIICDDGLQHYSLARDLEIVIIDGERLFGNGHCLPLGPLRERIIRLNTVDLIIFNVKKNNNINNNLINNNILKHVINIIPEKIYNLLKPNITKNPEDFSCVHAVSGIGNNQKFFNLLADSKIKTINHEFPDHYQYQPKDLCFNDDLPIIMTEKDAIKCVKFAKDNFWCQTIRIEFNNKSQFNEYLNDFLKLKLKLRIKIC